MTLGPAKDMVLECASSSVSTLEPYSYGMKGYFPLPQQKLKKAFASKKSSNSSREVLLSIFEPISSGKYMILALGNDKEIDNVYVFDINRAEITCEGDRSLLMEYSSPEESNKLSNLTKVNR